MLSIIVAYGTSYYRISRRGIEEAKDYGLIGFLYVPAEKVFASEDLSEHYRFARFYAPANLVDQSLFGGPPPVRSIMFRIAP